MADIFISYAHADRTRVEMLASALEKSGYSVWWDRHIEGGAEFSKDIERALNNAKAVIVCWSPEACDSRWVKDEATEAAEAGKLVALSMSGGTPPLGFRQYHAIDFNNWKGDGDEAVFDELKRAVQSRLGDGKAPTGKGSAPTHAGGQTSFPQKGLLAGLVALIAIVGVISFLFLNKNDGPPTEGVVAADEAQTAASAGPEAAPAPPPNSVAVLAFDDLSSSGGQAYFADGIAEEILNVLARVDGLRVASRTSSFALKDQPDLNVRAIGAALDVRYVLEGSVRKSGEAVRVTAQLIDSVDDRHLYSETFDRRLTAENIFEIQDEIARSIVSALGERDVIGGVARESIRVAAGTDDIRAYELFLEGHDIFVRREFPKFTRMIEAFEQAVARDPEFARAHAALAGAYGIQPGWGIFDRDYDALALASAKRALEIEPDLAFAYAVMADASCKGGDGCTEETDLLDRAIDLDPRDPAIFNWRGQHLGALGYFDAAIQDFERCLQLDPAYVNCRSHYAVALADSGRLDEALAQARNLMNVRVGALHNLYVAGSLAAAGRNDEAIELADNALSFFNPERVLRDQEGLGAKFVSLQDPATDHEKRWREDILAQFDDQQNVSEIMPLEMLYFYRRFEELDSVSGGNFYWSKFHKDFLQSERRYKYLIEAKFPEYWRERGFPPRCRPIEPLPNGRDFECD